MGHGILKNGSEQKGSTKTSKTKAVVIIYWAVRPVRSLSTL